MNEGLKLLMDRMDTNPEEFISGIGSMRSKWRNIVEQYAAVLPKEDMKAYRAKLNQLISEQFTAEILKELLKDDESPQHAHIATNPPEGSYRYNGPLNQAEVYMGGKWMPVAMGTIGHTSVVGGGNGGSISAYGGGGMGGSGGANGSSGMVIINQGDKTHTFSSTGVTTQQRNVP